MTLASVALRLGIVCALGSTLSCRHTNDESSPQESFVSGLPTSTSPADLAALEDPANPGHLNLALKPGPQIDRTVKPKPGESTLNAVQAVISGADDYYATSLCRSSRAASSPTSECRDFCDTFSPQTALDKSLLWSTWASWSSWLPASLRGSVGQGIAEAIGRAPVSPAVGQAVMCVPVALGYLAAEVQEQRRCREGTQCAACGDEAAARTACRVWDVARICAQNAGVTIPLVSPLGALARTCTLGTTLQREVYRNTCRGACQDSIRAATPVSQAETFARPDGTLGQRKLCCRCVREHRENGWFSDPVFKTDFFNGVTVATSEASDDCELREGREDYPESYEHNGYRAYYRYKRCEKYQAPGATCPTADDFDPYR